MLMMMMMMMMMSYCTHTMIVPDIIAVDKVQGYIFWYNGTATILRSEANGTNAMNIVNNSK